MFSFYSRIVVAYDGSTLGKKSLEMAKYLAKQDEKVEVHVLHAIYHGFGADYGLYEGFREKEQEKLESILNEAKEVVGDLPNKVDYVVLKGSPSEMILEYARNRDIDLIIIGSRGLSKIKELVLGSVSYNIVQHAQCPVLIAK